MTKYVEPKEITRAKMELHKVSVNIRMIKCELKLFERNNVRLEVIKIRNKLREQVRKADILHTILRQHNQMKKMHSELTSLKHVVRNHYGIE